MEIKSFHPIRLMLYLSAATLLITCPVQSQTSLSASITDKVICGYQGWFNCYGDGSPVARWVHWSVGQYQSDNGRPAPGHVTVDIYPDISIYKPASLFQTGLGNLGDGRPSKLFSSWLPDVIDTHFSIMAQNGIDGVALQRFIAVMPDGVFLTNHDSLSARVRRSAEKYNRVFYMQYDVSGLAEDKLGTIKSDWQYELIAKLHLTSSPMYAHQDGKPVICLWGFGFTGRAVTPAACLDVINWFKTQGYYVIGGVPTYWRTGNNDSQAGFENVYKAFDMISPWMVGRFVDNSGADWFRTNVIQPDIAYCNTLGIKYQSVIFPGFAWSNWNGGLPNQIPRNKGEFLWRQVTNLVDLGAKNAFLAMFDEYDEGTAILNMADSYYDVPANQYFLTSSADSTYISSDFYLRLAGKATRVMKGLDPLTPGVTIPHSAGPVYFRTSLERRFDAMPDWISSADPTGAIINVGGYGGTGAASLSAVRENPHIGEYALKFTGRDNSKTNSICYFRAFDVDIPIYSNTNLSFWTFPKDSLARHISIDLVMTDGSNLRDVGATDVNGVGMHPGTPRGTINAWSQTTCNIGHWLKGKTIDRIMVAYDMGPGTGDFCAYLDDIAVFTGDVFSAVNDVSNEQGLPVRIYPNPVSDGKFILDLGTDPGQQELLVTITDLQGRIQLQQRLAGGRQVEIMTGELPKGIHLVTIKGGKINVSKKLVTL